MGSLAARIQLTTAADPTRLGRLLEFLDQQQLTGEQRVWAQWLRATQFAETDLLASLLAACDAADHAERTGSAALPSILWGATITAVSVDRGDLAISLARRYRAWEESTTAPRSDGQPPWAGRALLGMATFCTGRTRDAEAIFEQVREMSKRWTFDESTPTATLMNVVVLDQATALGRGAFDESRMNEALHRLSGDRGSQLAFLHNLQAVRALQRGDLRAARALVDEGLSLSRAQLSALQVVLRLCFAVRLDALSGEHEALAGEVAELRRLCRRIGYRWGLAFANRAEGLLALVEGRCDEAVLHLERLLAETRLYGFGPEHPLLIGRADLVEALVRSGEPQRGREVLAELTDILDGLQSPYARGLLARARGQFATGPQAVEHLRLSAEAFAEAGDLVETARARLQLGEALRRDRRIGQARRELQAAAVEFERMGALPWLARARDELRATGSPVAGELPDAALTAQERRVVGEVAQGMTNKEVAAALYLSVRTVEHHLASAYRKLGVRNRGGLIRRMAAESDGPFRSTG